MADCCPRRALAEYNSGTVSASKTIATVLPALDSIDKQTRIWALWTLVEASRERPDMVPTIADSFVSSLSRGQEIPDEQLKALGHLAYVNADALEPVVDALAPAGSGEWMYEGDAALAYTIIGEIGSRSPGVCKSALESLIEISSSSFDPLVDTSRQEAAWAIVRISNEESFVLRPIIAGRFWALESERMGQVTAALTDLGTIFALCPDEIVEFDQIIEYLSHSDRRARRAALRALRRTAFGLKQKANNRLGSHSPELIHPYIEDIVELTTDPDPGVRAEAMQTLNHVAEHSPNQLRPEQATIYDACTDPDPDVRSAALSVMTTLTRAGQTNVDPSRDTISVHLLDDKQHVRRSALDCTLAFLDERGDVSDRVKRLWLSDVVWYICSTSQVVGNLETSRYFEVVKDATSHFQTLFTRSELANTIGSLSSSTNHHHRIIAAHLLTALSINETEVWWRGISKLQAMLCDSDADVREVVISKCGDLIEQEPQLKDPLSSVVLTSITYDPKILNPSHDTIKQIAAIDQEFARRIFDQYSMVLSNQDLDEFTDSEDDPSDLSNVFGENSKPSPDILSTIAKTSPKPLTSAVSILNRRFTVFEGQDCISVRTLAYIAASGGELGEETIGILRRGLQIWEPPADVVSWIATTLLIECTDEKILTNASDKLHSLAESEATPLGECIKILAAHEPDVVASLCGSLQVWNPSMETSEDEEALIDIACSSPRFTLVNRLPVSGEPRQVGVTPRPTEPDALETFAQQYPHVIRPKAYFQKAFLRGSDPPAAALLRTANSSLGPSEAQLKRRHPVRSVRQAAEIRPEGDVTSSTLPNAVGDISADATLDKTVDDIAKGLATRSVKDFRRTCKTLQEIGERNEQLQQRITLHLLNAVAGVNNSQQQRVLLETLAEIRGDTTAHNSEFATLAALISSYTESSSQPVREVAALLPRYLPEDELEEDIYCALKRCLTDDSPTVQERAARSIQTLLTAKPELAGRFTQELKSCLEGSRNTCIAAIEALGTSLVLRQNVSRSLIGQIETRLKSRSHGVRQAAMLTIAQVGRRHSELVQEVAGELVDRLQKDHAIRDATSQALSTVAVESITSQQRLADGLIEITLTGSDPCSIQAAGETLISLIKTAPNTVHSALTERITDLSQNTENTDSFVESDWFDDLLPSSQYWLLTVTTELSRQMALSQDLLSLLDDFGRECVDTHIKEGFDETNYTPQSGDISPRALRKATCDYVAQRGDEEILRTILESVPNYHSIPSLEPSHFVRYYLNSDDTDQDDVHQEVTDFLPQRALTDVIAGLVEQNEDDIAPTSFSALATITPVSNDRELHREVIAVAIRSVTNSNLETRHAGVGLLGKLGQTRVMPADEAITRLLSSIEDHQWVQEKLAEQLISLIPHSILTWRSVFEITAANIDHSNTIGHQRGCLIVLKYIGVRKPTLAEEVADRLLTSFSTRSEQLQALSGELLGEITRQEPSAVQPHTGRLQEYASSNTRTIAESAKQCLSILESL